jgi:hypothetical protein
VRRGALLALAVALAAAAPSASASASARDPAAEARRQAREILSQPRYRGSGVPRPLHGAFAWLGRKLAPVARPFHWLARQVPGGDATVWALLGGLVVLAAALLAGRTAARRGGRRLDHLERALVSTEADPEQLESAADGAERSGDLALALRLRFRAGLLRLAHARVIPVPDSLTSGEVRRLLRLREFDALARAHDEVVYGGRTASADDAARARESWPRVLEAARAQR